MFTQPENLELDSRFPSGEWYGFYLQPSVDSSRFRMSLHLTFNDGTLTGQGQDSVGQFFFNGRYDLNSGEVIFHKHYLGKYSVFYRGFAEGKGIWGTWEMTLDFGWYDKGGFHIWPKGSAEAIERELEEQVAAARQVERVALVD